MSGPIEQGKTVMPSLKKQSLILAGDIGGTKTVLGLFARGQKRPLLMKSETFSSREASRPEQIIGRFLDRHPAAVRSACFGVAGPVLKGRCRTTNLPWDVSEKRIGRTLNLPRVRLINDLEAMAGAVPLLSLRETVPLNHVKGQTGGNIALVAPGTGLGQALLIFDHGRYVAVPSEGGHVDFAPRDEDQVRLWRSLRLRWNHVSVERLLSGPGLHSIYAWLRDSGRYREPLFLSRWLHEMDPAGAITRAALERKSPLAVESLRVFVSILGAVCGNLALTGLTTGGLYLGGGIPPKILPALKGPHFLRAFTDKGRFGALVEKIPVRVILNENAALLGAARCALSEAEQGDQTKLSGNQRRSVRK